MEVTQLIDNHTSLFLFGSSTIKFWPETYIREGFSKEGYFGVDLIKLREIIRLKDNNEIPDNICVYAGGNDLQSGISVSETIGRYNQLLLTFKEKNNSVNLFTFDILPHPRFKKFKMQIEEFNKRINSEFTEFKHISLGRQFYGASNWGEPNYFADDGIHLNEYGYDRLNTILSENISPNRL